MNGIKYIFYISILITNVNVFGMFGFGRDLTRKELPKHHHFQPKFLKKTTSTENILTEKNQNIGRGRSISDTPVFHRKS